MEVEQQTVSGPSSQPELNSAQEQELSSTELSEKKQLDTDDTKLDPELFPANTSSLETTPQVIEVDPIIQPAPTKPYLLKNPQANKATAQQVAARIEKAVVPLLSWDDVVRETLNNAIDLRIIEVEKESKEAAKGEALAEYLPQVNLAASLEYVDDLTDAQTTTGVTSVGDTFVLPLDINQSVASANLNWTLIDFGKRKAQLDITKSESVQKDYERNVTKKAILLEALSRYEDAFKQSHTLGNRQKITALRKQLLDVQNRLFTAGVVPKLEVADAAIANYRAEEELRTAERQAQEALTKLSGLTKQLYEPTVTTLLTLPDMDAPVQPKTLMGKLQIESLPEYKFYSEAIKQKEREYDRIQRERWAPTISGYSSYVLFGSDADDPLSAVGQLSQSNLRVGLSARWTLFDGFRLKSQAKQAALEVERLKLMRQQKLDEWKNRVETAAHVAEDTQITLAMSQQTKALLQDKGVMVDRLSQQQLIDTKTQLEHQIEMLRHELSQELLLFEHRKAQKELELYQLDPS